jgi:hypothetical protein
MEAFANENGLDLSKMSLMEKEALWQQMKK